MHYGALRCGSRRTDTGRSARTVGAGPQYRSFGNVPSPVSIGAVSSPLLNRHRMLQRLALLAAMALCLGQSAADAHLHLDELEDEACIVCGFSDPGQGLDVEGVDGVPSEWCPADSVPLFSTLLVSRQFEVSRSRDPPVS